MKTKEARPKGFVMFMHSLRSGLVLPDESAGRAFKAAARYFLEGTEPENVEDFNCGEQIVYTLLRENIATSLKKHQEVVARNRKIASSRSSARSASSPAALTENDEVPLVTTGDETLLTE